MRKLAVIVLAAILMVSCSSVKVTTDYDKTVDFTQFKTLEYWGWSNDSDQLLNRFDKDRIESAFNEEFKKRGIDVVEKGNGDMIVSLFILTEQKTSKSATTTAMGGVYGDYGYGGFYDYGPGYGWGTGHSTTTFHEHEYTVGTLVISVFDAKKKELIWEAVGEGTVDDNPQSRDEGIPEAVEQIMKDYPVQTAG